MKNHSSTYPITTQGTPIKFKTPFNITSAIYTQESHYIGYELTDANGITVDVFDIPELKEGIKNTPSDFANVKVNNLGHLDIDDYENLPHEVNEDYDKARMSSSLFALLQVDEKTIMPSKIFQYKEIKNSAKTVINYRCSFTKDFKDFIKYSRKNKAGSSLEIPQPLLTLNGVKVADHSNMFASIVFNDINVDFSAIDLRFCENANNLFKKVSIDNLEIKPFNLSPQKADNLFQELKCETLDLSGCNFRDITNFDDFFKSCRIEKIKAKGIKTGLICSGDINHSPFAYAYVGVLDLDLYNNIDVDTIYHFRNLTCDKFTNIHKLPTKNATDLSNLFNGLCIDTLDVTKLNTDSLETCQNLFAYINCNNFIFNDDMLSNTSSAIRLFYRTVINSDLDLSNASFNNLEEYGAEEMFNELEVKGTLVVPSDYGSANNFTKTFSKIKVNELDLSFCNFSKAITIDRLLYSSKIGNIIPPNSKTYFPQKLKSADKIIYKLDFKNIALEDWHFDSAKSLNKQLNR